MKREPRIIGPPSAGAAALDAHPKPGRRGIVPGALVSGHAGAATARDACRGELLGSLAFPFSDDARDARPVAGEPASAIHPRPSVAVPRHAPDRRSAEAPHDVRLG